MDRPVQTFSVGFAEAGAGNELADARFMADLLGTDHHELELSVSEQTISLDRLLWHLDEPVADLSSLGLPRSFGAGREARHRRSLRPGSGRTARRLSQAPRCSDASAWKRVPSPIRRASLAIGARGPDRLRRPVATLGAAGAVERLLSMSGSPRVLPFGGARPWPAGGAGRQCGARAIAYRLGDFPDEPLPATLFIDGQLGLVDDMLHYFDRASMAHSLEVRVPFLDHEFVESARTIPADLKVHRLETKHVLRHAARGLVPDRIIDKPKIGFFTRQSTAGSARRQTARSLTTSSPRTRDTRR